MPESLFDPYLPAEVRRLEEVVQAGRLPHVEEIPGAVLFADVSGFSAMSEQLLLALGRAGAEVLTSVLNGYFGRMIGLASARGGTIQKFGGDAMTILFAGEPREAVARAVSAATEMQGAMGAFTDIETPAGKFTLAMKCGIAAGTSRLILLGDPENCLDYAIEGEPVDGSAEAEHAAVAGEVVLGPSAVRFHATPDVGEKREGGCLRIPAGSPAAATPPHGVPGPLPPANERFLPAPLRSRVAAGDALLRNEHRQVGCLFVRFPGADYSNPAVLAKLQEFHLRTVAILDRFGGILAKVDFGDKGSKLLAVFGAPVALEKPEESAVRAMQEIFVAAKETVGEPAAGIASGAVFAGDVGNADRREYTVMGDTVNLSARLMQKAGFGRILVSEATFRAAPSIEWREVEPFLVKGKVDPVRAAEPLSRREADSRASDAPGLPRPAVEEPLLRAIGLLAEKGTGSSLELTGPAGSGKSRLVDLALAVAEAAGLHHQAHRVRPWDANVPFALGRFLATRRLGLDEEASSGRREVRLRMALATRPEFGDSEIGEFLRLLGGRESASRGAGTPEELESRAGLAAAVLSVLLGEEPMLLAVDGADQLDDFSLRVLGRLAREHAPRVLLATSRTPVVPAAATLGIPPLDAGETGRLLALLLTDDRIDARLSAFVEARSGGNPRYVTALVSELRRSGAVRFDPVAQAFGLDEARLRGASFESLESLLLRPLDLLPEDVRRVAKGASVLGDRFPEELLSAAMPEIPAQELSAVLARLESEGILGSANGERHFRESLLRATIFETVPAEARRRFAALAARRLDRSHPERLDERAELWHRAGRAAKSIPLLEKAALRARRSLLPRVALRHFETLRTDWEALPERGRTPRLDSTRRRALVSEVETRISVGDFEAAEALMASSTSRSEEDSSERLRLLELAAQVSLQRARFERGLAEVLEFKECAEKSADREWFGRALLLEGSFLARTGRLDAAVAGLRECVEILAGSRDRETFARALRTLGNCRLYRGELEEAVGLFRRAADLVRGRGHGTALPGILINRAVAEIRLGRRRQAARCLDEAVRILKVQGGGPLLAVAYSSLNALAYAEGDLAASVRWSRLHQECTVHLGNRADRILSATFLADVLVLTGEVDELRNVLGDIFGEAGGAFDPQAVVDLALKGARGLAEAGADDEALALLDDAERRVTDDECDRRPMLALTRDLLLGRSSGVDPAVPSGSTFLEDRLFALATGGNAPLDPAELTRLVQEVVKEALRSCSWLAALEGNDLLARFGATARIRSASHRRIAALAERLQATLWQRRATLLASAQAGSEPLLSRAVIRRGLVPSRERSPGRA